jgi:hypothetical protein
MPAPTAAKLDFSYSKAQIAQLTSDIVWLVEQD